MIKYLGIDYGKKHLGLAISDGIFAEPFGKLKIKSQKSKTGKGEDKRIRTIIGIINEIKPAEIIIGISEGEMAKETREFGQRIKKETKLPVIFWDETLTTQEATKKMVEGRMAKKRRRKTDHDAAAALILQSYLDDKMLL